MERKIPFEYIEYKRVNGAVVYYRFVNNRYMAMGWKSDRQVKCEFNYYFTTEEKREEFVTKWFESIVSKDQLKNDNKLKMKAIRDQPNPFKEGDIFCYSWGYEQTNVNFYQVVGVKSKSVILREIACKSVNDDAQGLELQSMADYVIPVKDNFTNNSEEFIKVVKWFPNGIVYLRFDHSIATKWDGQKCYRSWYA